MTQFELWDVIEGKTPVQALLHPAATIDGKLPLEAMVDEFENYSVGAGTEGGFDGVESYNSPVFECHQIVCDLLKAGAPQTDRVRATLKSIEDDMVMFKLEGIRPGAIDEVHKVLACAKGA